MSKPREESKQAVKDLERCLIYLARASERLRYVFNYIEDRGGNDDRGLWDKIADAENEVREMLEDDTLEDAAEAKRQRRRR